MLSCFLPEIGEDSIFFLSVRETKILGKGALLPSVSSLLPQTPKLFPSLVLMLFSLSCLLLLVSPFLLFLSFFSPLALPLSPQFAQPDTPHFCLFTEFFYRGEHFKNSRTGLSCFLHLIHSLLLYRYQEWKIF